MRFSEKVAFLVTERRGLMWSAVVLIAITSVGILVAFLRLDTEVLNLLPRGFDSVEGLKVYNSEFAQTRELTFALLCQPEDVDKLEEFAPKFVERLRAQPWCVRVLAGSPWKRRMECAIYNESRSRFCSISSQTNLIEQFLCFNRRKFRNASRNCGGKSKAVRRGRK